MLFWCYLDVKIKNTVYHISVSAGRIKGSNLSIWGKPVHPVMLFSNSGLPFNTDVLAFIFSLVANCIKSNKKVLVVIAASLYITETSQVCWLHTVRPLADVVSQNGVELNWLTEVEEKRSQRELKHRFQKFSALMIDHCSVKKPSNILDGSCFLEQMNKSFTEVHRHGAIEKVGI